MPSSSSSSTSVEVGNMGVGFTEEVQDEPLLTPRSGEMNQTQYNLLDTSINLNNTKFKNYIMTNSTSPNKAR